MPKPEIVISDVESDVDLIEKNKLKKLKSIKRIIRINVYVKKYLIKSII
jgi:hypothetical protein